MSGGVPATTSSTTTVNQSPWQNPTYQALMLGSTNDPGPITQMLRNSSNVTNAYNNMIAQGVTPMDITRSNIYNPTAGGAGTAFNGVAQPATPTNVGQTLAQDYQQSLGRTPDVAGETYWANQLNTGNLTPSQVSSLIQSSPEGQAYQKAQSASTKKAAKGGIMNVRKFASGSSTDTSTDTSSSTDQTANTDQQLLAQAMGQTAYTQVNPLTGQLESTNPLFNQAVSEIQGAQQLPGQFGQATTDYNQAISGLQGAANYTPQQVAAQQAAAQGYGASSMAAPSDVSAQSYNAASMQGGPNVTGATIAGPQDWTSAGTAQQYMNPYIQNVLNNQLQIQNQQNAIANNALKGQAAQAKAYGGAREQLALGQQQFNQNLANQNMVQNALANAYQSGLGQFNTAQQQQLTAQQANQSSLNQANLANQLYGAGGYQTQAANMAAQNQAMQNFVNNQLAAATTSYGGQLTAAQQNQVAQNAAAQFQAQAANAASLQNAQLGTQAAQANQQAGLTANAQNLSAYNNMLSGAQGLGALGAQQASTNLNNIAALGQGASALQNLGQQYLNTQSANAQNALNLPSTINAPVTNAINAQPASGGATTQTGTSTPASWFGKGGAVQAHKAWDKAKGGKVNKKGIASTGW